MSVTDRSALLAPIRTTENERGCYSPLELHPRVIRYRSNLVEIPTSPASPGSVVEFPRHAEALGIHPSDAATRSRSRNGYDTQKIVRVVINNDPTSHNPLATHLISKEEVAYVA